METRTRTENKLYFLACADMRGGIDRVKPIIGSYCLERLLKHIEGEREIWTDEIETPDFYGNSHSYKKTFKKGSTLEWYNCPNLEIGKTGIDGGIMESWVDIEYEITIELI